MFKAFHLTAVLIPLLMALWLQKDSAPKTPQDPCADVLGQQPMNQCAAEQYHKADERLNKIYADIQADIKKDMQIPAAHNEEYQAWNRHRLEKLQAAERAWLRYRELNCEAARYEYEGGTINPLIWAECMRSLTETRIQELKDAYPVDGEPRK